MNTFLRAIGFLLIWTFISICTAAHVYADVEWKVKKQLTLNVSPLDIAQSSDGQLIFILAQGEILIYSVSDDKYLNSIPVDKGFDRLTYSEKNNIVIISSSSEKLLKIIQLNISRKIDVSGSPFKGPENAPVTIVVFSDYQ